MRQRKRPSSLYRGLQDIDMVNVRMVLKQAREIFFCYHCMHVNFGCTYVGKSPHGYDGVSCQRFLSVWRMVIIGFIVKYVKKLKNFLRKFFIQLAKEFNRLFHAKCINLTGMAYK